MAQRELKFRAWGTHNGHSDGIMLYDDDGSGNMEDGILNLHTMRIHYADTKWTAGSGEWVEYPITTEDETTVVMQFTGLKDKNGIEIYEGDIVRIAYKPTSKSPIEYYKIGVIVYKCNYFGVMCKIEGIDILDESRKLSTHRTERRIYKHPTEGVDWVDKRATIFAQCEIIGNIYENSELLIKPE